MYPLLSKTIYVYVIYNVIEIDRNDNKKESNVYEPKVIIFYFMQINYYEKTALISNKNNTHAKTNLKFM